MAEKALLMILDGWGIGKHDKSDAIFNANTPFTDSLYINYPNTTLRTDGENVGLPKRQMGNSEVGHMNIGAGRIIWQMLVKINKAFENKSINENLQLLNALNSAKKNNNTLHLMGLISDGGVHSHLNHCIALAKIANDFGIENIFIHAFLDGRDTDPKSGIAYLKTIEQKLQNTNAHIATIIGRYYAMDRDKRWERVSKAYHLLVNKSGEFSENKYATIENYYSNNVTDEFMEPIYCLPNDEGKINENDTVICFNFRTDRGRQITTALTQENFENYNMKKINLHYYTMTNYDDTFKINGVFFDDDNLKNTLGEVISNNKLSQLRAAETEKYPHVTFFFSGGREKEFDGEIRILANSPKVATYDLQPEMSAPELAEKVSIYIESNAPDFVCINFANPDMVGHTGVYNAIIKAVETTDSCAEKVIHTALQNNYHCIIIADHGNADFAINEDGTPNTAHTTNPVPCWLVSNTIKTTLNTGILADVAPTVLKLMQVPQPIEMTGKSLINA